MKAGNVCVAIFLAAGLLLPAGVSAQADKPGAVMGEAVEVVVVVRAVDQEARKVVIETPDGVRATIVVPPHAQNLDQVSVGSRFRMRYLQSVAVLISPEGGEPSAAEVTEMQLAEKGATPGGAVVNVRQVQARVEEIDYATRTVVLTGPDGNRVKVTADESVRRLAEVKPGDMVVVRYTEGLAMQMIKE